MNLYKISQTINNDYDTYDSAIVAATCWEDAAQIHPGGPTGWESFWAKPENVKVELVGVAAEGIEAGAILCASFNAG